LEETLATNLKRSADKDKKEDKTPKARPSFDLKWVLAAVGLIVIVIGSVIAGIYLAPNKIIVQEKEKKTFVSTMPVVPPKPGPSLSIVSGEVVNLKAGRYLRFSVAIQFVANEKLFPGGGGGGEGKKVDPLAPYADLMKDVIVTDASRHTADDLLKPAGKEKLKEEIKRDINQQLKDQASTDPDHPDDRPRPQVLKVYFTDFVIQ
jgi:flagellar basal body-associated protein FliL